MKTLFVLDLDGNILDVSALYKQAGREPDRNLEPEKHKEWVKKVIPSMPLPAIRGSVSLVKSLAANPEVDFIFLTGRTEMYRKITEYNLKQLGLLHSPTQLIMRENGDNRDYATMKEAVIMKFHESYSAVVVFDDDPDTTLETVCKRNNWSFYKSMTGGYEKS